MGNHILNTGGEGDPGRMEGNRSVDGGWGDVFLAALPFLLILIAGGLPMLLVESGLLAWDEPGMRTLTTIQATLLVGALLGIFILAWRRKWPTWSATWLALFFYAPLLLAASLVNLAIQGRFDFVDSQGLMMYIGFPLGTAILLYAVTRLDPLRGILASLPVIYLLWQPNMEFVPDTIELTVKVPSVALICMAIAYVIQRGDWRAGLYAVLTMNLGVGALFAYAGTYYGGTLPFSAPGPNLVEVMRSLIPQYLATSAILLGPLFAWKYRQIGFSAGWKGKGAYHLALTGLLLVILANLAGLMGTLQADSFGPTSFADRWPGPLIILGVAAYLGGVAWLYRYGAPLRTTTLGVERVLLLLLPLAIPFTFMLTFITWRWPVSNLYGIPLLWELPHPVSLSLGLVWLALSIWVVTREGESSGASTSLQRAPQVNAPKG